MNNHTKKNAPTYEAHPKFLFIVLTLFISFWLISNIAAIKIVSFFGIILTGGFLTFPFTTTLNCLIAEIYGYKQARQAIWSGFTLNITYLIFINIINYIPSSPDWKLEHAFHIILVPHTRIILASLIAFWLSGFANSYLIAKLKFIGKSLALRIILSLFIALTIDINIFFAIGFLGITPYEVLSKIFMYAFVKKIFCEILLLPIIWFLIDFLKRKEGFEIYDNNTNFTPFSLDNVYDLESYKLLSPKPRQ